MNGVVRNSSSPLLFQPRSRLSSLPTLPYTYASDRPYISCQVSTFPCPACLAGGRKTYRCDGGGYVGGSGGCICLKRTRPQSLLLENEIGAGGVDGE